MSTRTVRASSLGLSVEEIFARVAAESDSASDSDLARALAVGRSSIPSARERDTLPFEPLFAFAKKHGLSMDWLLTGEGEKRIDSVQIDAEQLRIRDTVLGDDEATKLRFPDSDPAAIRRGRAELRRLAAESGEGLQDPAQPYVVVPNDPKRTKPIAAPGFEAVIARLKEAIGLKNNAGAGELLGLDPATFKKLQKADLVPYEALMPVAYIRDINLQWLLYGEGEPCLSADHLHIGTNGRAANLDLVQECVAALTFATRARLAEVDPRSFGRACVLLYEISYAAGRVATSSVGRLAETILSSVGELETAEPRKRP